MSGEKVKCEKELRAEVFQIRRELIELLGENMSAGDAARALELVCGLEKHGEDRGEEKVWKRIERLFIPFPAIVDSCPQVGFN